MKTTLSLLISMFFLNCFAFQVNAQTMSNSYYILEQGSLNSFAGKATGPSNAITDAGGTLAPGIYQGTNYLIRANFAYGLVATTSSTFSFSISNTSVNFGTITPGEPVIRTNQLTVSSPNSGYQVSTSQNSPLVNSGGATIPDTTCDAGNCTQSTSAIWTSPLTYGFGYRCDNLASTDCSSNFSKANYYMQFPNLQGSESAQVVMSKATSSSNSQSQITYKLNISSTQAPGSYQNSIKYIAIPSL